MLCFFVSGISCYLLFYKKTNGPIEQLYNASVEIGRGQFNLQLNISTHDEWETLGDAFNSMVHSIQQLMEESVEKERILKQMEINRLMLQINPHFIYNTLNSIVYMAQMEGNGHIVNFTNAFISYFKIL